MVEPCDTNPGNISVFEQIETEMEKFKNMKSDFSENNIKQLPDTIEELLTVLEPLYAEIEKRYEAVTHEFSKYENICSKENKGHYYHLMGKLCNLFEDHTQDALPYFKKGTKFMPNEIEFWNELGDCYLSLGTLTEAKHCFNEALRRKENCWSYRSISIACRREAHEKGFDTLESVNSGVDFAKKAITIDPTDGYSWMILGNAYMAHILTSREEQVMPTKALQAYAQAEKNNGRFPELFFNKAVALLYAEEYARCLESLEDSVRVDPGWKHAWKKYYEVKSYVIKLSEFCSSKSIVKLRKNTQYIIDLNRELSSIIESDMLVSSKYKNLYDLVEGVNHDTIIMGKILWSCEMDKSFPFTFGFVDRSSHLLVVSIYNLTTGNGIKIGDTVAISNPNYSSNSCIFGNKECNFFKIRVDSPKDLIVNGKVLPESHIGQTLTITKCE